MAARLGSRFPLLVGLILIAADAIGAGRAIRVDNSANWNISAVASAVCSGTTLNSTQVTKFGFTFSGRANTATENYLVNDYCEVAVAGTLNKYDYFHDDENGLRELFGNGTNALTAIRYDYLDNSVASAADGFQWTFFSFPDSVTVVGLYGLDGSINGIVPNATSSIKKGSTVIWSGSSGYNGEYFCFKGTTYIGTWDGNASDKNSACLKALGMIFYGGFESSN